jgi:thymidylate synthase (FAD)
VGSLTASLFFICPQNERRGIVKIIKAGYEILDNLNGVEILKKIELCGRVCYKSEDKMTEDSAKKFVANIIKRGHESVLEHFSFSVRFIVDRGISHELVRHRIASFSQESTRYCNYGHENEITVIDPFFWPDNTVYVEAHRHAWKRACLECEKSYMDMIKLGRVTPQEARSVLPNSLKTEVIMTANLREWRHFLKLRTSTAAHPQMREVTIPLLLDLAKQIPVVFDDLIN